MNERKLLVAALVGRNLGQVCGNGASKMAAKAKEQGMAIKVGDTVIAGGMPGTVLAIKVIGASTQYEVLVEVPQVRWFPAAQVNDGTTPPPPTPPGPVPTPHPVLPGR